MKLVIPKLPFDHSALFAKLVELRKRAAALPVTDPALLQLMETHDLQPASGILACAERLAKGAAIVKEAVQRIAALAEPHLALSPKQSESPKQL